MTERERNLFLIAARAPVPGQTKTRLGNDVGMERAACLYRAFLVDLARRFTPAAGDDPGWDLGWAHSPAEADFPAILTELGCPPPAEVRFVGQQGDGWGERQRNLLLWGHQQRYGRTVLVASDSPHMPRSTPALAFAALAENDVALGRVLDGGYYLIGLRGFHDVFAGVPMSTGDAADALVARSVALGLRVAELPPTFDVDEAADLLRLRRFLARDGLAAPVTWAALGSLGLGQNDAEP